MLAGAEIGRYRLEQRLARGGMAEVWAASVRGPGDFLKAFALKFILAHFDEDPEAERLFVQEARLAASFSHPNLVAVFDFDRIADTAHPSLAGRYFIAMEKVDGGNLLQLIQSLSREGKSVPEPQVAYIAVEALKGLCYLHEHGDLGLVHRDLSPQNILLTRSGQVKVSDFGVAKATSMLSRARSNTTYGKLPYLAPEIVRGADASVSSDLFALGVVLWETFSGTSLFARRTDAETIDRIARCDVPTAVSREGNAASEPFEHAVSKLLGKTPAERFRTTDEALNSFLALPTYDPSPLPLARLLRQSSSEVEPSAKSTPAAPVIPTVSLSVEPPVIAGGTQVLPVGVGHTKLLGPPLSEDPRQQNSEDRESSTSTDHGFKQALSFGYVQGFDERRLAQQLSQAFERFENARTLEDFGGSFEDWVVHMGAGGMDPISGQPLPPSFSSIIKWPRFLDVGWKIRLSPEWCGPRPWGAGGSWVAEDRLGGETMPIFSRDLNRPLFQHLTRDAWVEWWLAREVDILSEGPLEGKPPISVRARALLLDGELPPLTRAAWSRLLGERDPQAASTDIFRRIDGNSSDATRSKRTFWQRLFEGEKK